MLKMCKHSLFLLKKKYNMHIKFFLYILILVFDIILFLLIQDPNRTRLRITGGWFGKRTSTSSWCWPISWTAWRYCCFVFLSKIFHSYGFMKGMNKCWLFDYICRHVSFKKNYNEATIASDISACTWCNWLLSKEGDFNVPHLRFCGLYRRITSFSYLLCY